MAHIVMFISNIGADDTGSGVLYGGYSRLSTMTSADASINFWVNQDANELAATVNAAIKTAAIDAATAAGYTVGALDKRTLIGAAVGL